MKHAYLYLFVFLFVSAPLAATDYYVAKDGDDANPGTESAPFLTLAKAAEVMDAGDVCHIKAGTYHETLTPQRGGTAGMPQVWKAFGTDEVWIDATEEVTGWEAHAGNVWKAPANLSLGRQDAVYYNGDLLDRARWPNNEDEDPYTIDAENVTGGAAGQIVAADLPAADLTGGYVWYLGAHSGTSWTREITSTSGKNINFEAVDINRWPFTPHNPTLVRNGNRGRFFVFGALDLLDYQREWHYQDGTLYLQAPNNADPKDGTVRIAARERTIHLQHDYLTVEGLNVFGGKVHLQGNNCVVRSNVIRHGLELLDELDNTDAQVGNGAIHVQSSDNLIENNLIEYGSLNGVWIQGWGGVQDNTITQNEIRYFNTVGIHASPIRAVARGTVVTHNTVYGTGRDGIFLPNQDCEFAYNDFSDVMRINNDGGLFYVVGGDDDKNTSVHHNWFHDSQGPEYADGRCAGIYLDNNSKAYDVHHNVVWNISWSAVQMNWSAWNNNIINNSFWDVGGAMDVWLNGHTQLNNRVINNYASSGGWKGQEITSNLIAPADPFADVDDQDFLPAAGSPLIDAGIEVAGVTDGFLGSAPDLGAYESGADAWVPGATRAGVTTPVRGIAVPRLAVAVFPNPAVTRTNIRFELDRPATVRYALLTLDGRQVRGGEYHLGAGVQSLELGLAGLPAGTYLLQGRSAVGIFARKVVVR